MRFQKLDLNLLVALDALLRECSISRAAEQLHLSQSAMSSALARLRAYFDDDLLVPVGRRLELTSRAEALKVAVRDVLMRVDTAIATAPEFDPAASDRRFQVIVSDYTAVTLMPHVLALARKQSRGVRFDLLPLQEPPRRALEAGEADLLVIPHLHALPDHPAETLFDEGFCCVVWSQSRFARAGELTAVHYETAGHVVMKPQFMDKPTMEDWLQERYANVRRTEATTSAFLIAPYLLVGTDRIAMMHVRLARIAQKSLPLTLFPMPVPMPRMQQTQQWHKLRAADPGLVWLRGLMHEAVLRMDAETDPAPPG